MQTGRQPVAILDINTIHDLETGEETKEVISGRKLIANVDLVGINTAQLGQAQGFNLKYSVEVPRMLYEEQKYVYFKNNLYAVKSQSKARLPVNMLLNIEESDDSAILEAIREWLRK